ncbi:hypothetical protein B0T18DRAFT_484338 [Schizothecium vesticola]|uniref:Uncharacterized protein n=1 Tax=Schizothecium vesticola TaxID=314040 RepID=A0AA40KCF6_9PEZI|nr:hypothetical protein B0T18DRAFT_484338 [Schizothecium vesticola]
MARRMRAAGEQMRRADAGAALAAMTPRSHALPPLPPGMGIYGWAACGCPLVEGLVPRRGVGMLPWGGGTRGPARREEQHQRERYIRGTYDGVPERRRRTSAPPPRLAFRRTPTPVARAARAHFFATARQHWIGGEGEGGYFTASEVEETTEDDDSLATWEVYGDYDDVPYYEEDPEEEEEEEEEDDESLGWDFMNGDYARPEVVYRSFLIRPEFDWLYWTILQVFPLQTVMEFSAHHIARLGNTLFCQETWRRKGFC